ncbi:ribosomal protein S18 acetylase RimI-like enzyme [Neomicrococcus aestuarii]|uniref:Ribosomal protein S18 acetylase RimI-like enzyme n=1 Tax=Neomicrococcus aestuarii TaxID=556325 RepID=A0A7W8WYL4_9MICC|nr:GNAT family N-acetyltransferase [Neomicrococcus aestuarii]MBB5512466.1 ribosomal protein S18 acetylase RimI-like enzyme [Neomicrococcus aestuarii]
MTSSEPRILSIHFKDHRIESIDGGIVEEGTKWILVAAVRGGARRNGHVLIRRKFIRKMVPVGKFTNLAANVVGSWPPAPLLGADGQPLELDLNHGRLSLQSIAEHYPVLGFHYERRKGEGLVDGVLQLEDDDAALRFRIVTDEGRVRSGITTLDRSSLIALEIGSSRLSKLAAKMADSARVEETLAVEAPVVEAPADVEIISATKAFEIKPSAYLVRLANFQDVPGIQALHRRGGYAPPSPRFLERVIADEDSLVVVAVDREESVVGWAKANYIPSSIADPAGYYLTGVRVDDDHRRNGLAREMAGARLSWLRRRTDTVFASVPAPNQPARHYLSSLGFREIPQEEAPVQPGNSVLLELTLDAGQAR